MTTKIYILVHDGEPVYATTDINVIEKECRDWFDHNRNGWYAQKEFVYWVEDRYEYEKTEEGEERAWNDFVEAQFENGTWGDYAWYDCFLK